MFKKPTLEVAAREGVALTFNDVRLRTGYSEVLPDDVDVTSYFSRNVPLKVPIVSSPMDKVTEFRMAIEMAKLGGLGIIHRGLSTEEQVRQVARVKHYLNGKIETPIVAYESETVEELLNRCEEKGFQFRSFPVLDQEKRFVGIITGNDFEFCESPLLRVGEVMSREAITATPDIDLNRAYKIMMKERKKALPLVDEEGSIKGMYVLSDVKRIITRSGELYNVDRHGQLRVGAAVGTTEGDLERALLLERENVDVLVIDTAHGDSKNVYTMLKKLKREVSIDVVAGNVSVGTSALRLAKADADGIKIGQGPGSICTSRIIAGIGRPQVSAVYDCARVIRKYDIPLCADGGLEESGDIPIAIGAGAACVMMGSMLAGTDEAPSEIIFFEGKQWKEYRGMGSLGAMRESAAGRERYQQSGKNPLVPEGVEVRIEYKGSLANVLAQYVGGLRKGMGYVGAASIRDLQRKAQFDRITHAGLRESHPHGVTMTTDAPNYSRKL